ncbi:MAG: DUF4097 family beta strand repeat protein [Pyrinomonadaceae bacterium]|nr:DUF4097 family beta strand repeat protein [Pyrinomonadaceae bacterium]
MRYKLLVASFLVLTAFAAAHRGFSHFHKGAALTNHWAMAALFWNNVLDATETANASNTAAATDSQEEFRWQGRVQPGQTFEIKGVNGNVRAEGYGGSQVEVVASKKGNRSDPKEVEIRVVEHAGGVTICAVYPSDDSSRPNDCQPGRGGHMNVRNNDVSVDFTVKVPAGVRFSGRTVNGEVEAERIGSDVEASTVNGSINVSAAGITQANTVNGSIKASMGAANWANELKFNTVNGSIILEFPSSLSADVRAETLNGDVTSDFPMNVQSTEEVRPGRPKRISATIGGGGRALTLKTINGDIRIKRGARLDF